MTDRHIYLAQTNVVPGREEEFNDWYDHEHLSDILSMEGWIAAQRFRASDRPGSQNRSPYEYLTIYEMEGDVRANMHRLSEKMRSGIRISTAMMPNPSAHVFAPIGDRITRP